MELVLEAERYKSMRQSVGDLPGNLRVGEKINSLVHFIYAEALRDQYQIRSDELEFLSESREAR
jgi:hypothetical protein